MKSYFFLITLLLLGYPLYSQTQTLPDLRVTGDNGYKAYLYKRSLMFSTLETESDSLPYFIPMGNTSAEPTKPKQAKKPLGYAQLEGNSDFGLNSFVSLYPNNNQIYNVNHHLDLRAPEANLTSMRNTLYIGGELAPSMPSGLKLNQASSKSSNFSSSLFDITLVNRRAQLDYSSFQINDFNLKLGYNYLKQENLGSVYQRDYLNVNLLGNILSGWLDANSNLVIHSAEFGIQVAPKINWNILDGSNIRAHVLADKYCFIPSIGFLYRTPLSFGGVLSLSNTPGLESNDNVSQLDNSSWVQFGDKHKLQKTPLNLQGTLEFIHPDSWNYTLTRLSISNLIRYDVHKPALVSGLNYGVAEVDYIDVISSLSSVEAMFKLGKVTYHQGVNVDLAYKPRDFYFRVPYRPSLKLDSKFSYGYQNWHTNFGLEQNYFTKDHQDRNLPEFVNFYLGVEYSKGGSAIYTQLDNLLDQPSISFTEQPLKGRNIYLGLKHRF